ELTRVSFALERFIKGWARGGALGVGGKRVTLLTKLFSACPGSDDTATDAVKPACNVDVPGSPSDHLLRKLEAMYPFPALLYWAQPDGMQMEKWTTNRATTPLIKLKGTVAFEDAVHGRLWGLRRKEGPRQPPPFAFHVRSSRNTGASQASLAMPIRDES